jgi:hypothetical protein
MPNRRMLNLATTGAAFMVLPGTLFADDAKKPDSGKFTLTIQGAKAGSCTFKADSEGGSEADIAIEIAGQKQNFKVSVKAKDGKVISVGASAGPTNHYTAVIEGAKAKVSINDAAPDTQSVPAGAIPFGNFSPHLLNHLLAAFDTKKGGVQAFDLLMVEGLPNAKFMSLKCKLSIKGTIGRKIAGKPMQITGYDLVLQAGATEVEMKLFANSDRHLLAWDVPDQGYTAVRDGYEDIMKAAPPAK